jgi:hypothetical protein
VVLWSAWDNPKRPTPVEVDRTASRIASQIKAAFDKK